MACVFFLRLDKVSTISETPALSAAAAVAGAAAWQVRQRQNALRKPVDQRSMYGNVSGHERTLRGGGDP